MNAGAIAPENEESPVARLDFFRSDALVTDSYPYYDAMRGQCPVRREPHHGVAMVTGYDEAAEILHDSATYSSCVSVTGPFPGFPVPLELTPAGEETR
jgi:cytochrome P450